jgi:hypothetical protein
MVTSGDGRCELHYSFVHDKFGFGFIQLLSSIIFLLPSYPFLIYSSILIYLIYLAGGIIILAGVILLFSRIEKPEDAAQVVDLFEKEMASLFPVKSVNNPVPLT